MIVNNQLRSREKRQPIYSGALGILRRAVDRAVGIVAPTLEHKMMRARIQSEALLAYEAAKVSRTAPSVPALSADAEVLPDAERLRGGSRQMTRDDPHAASSARLDEENIVGEGVTPRAMASAAATGMTEEQAKAWNDAATAEFKRWAEEDADATGHGTFYDMQRLVVRTRKVDGELLWHALVGGDGYITCELIDADRLESPFAVDTPTIRGGVEIDAKGRPLAYHVLKEHPRDAFAVRRFGPLATDRYPVEGGGFVLMGHVFRRERVGQTRGVPDLSACLPYLRHLHHYLNSELIGARAASNYALFIKREATPTDADILPVQAEEAGQTMNYHEVVEPGTIAYLNEGEEPVPFSPNRPGTQFEPFVARLLRAISAGLGMSYEVLARDFRGLSWTAIRGMLNELRRRWDTDRASLCRQFCTPWYRNVIRAAIAGGRLKAPPRFFDNERAFLAVQWIPPPLGWVDPVKEIEASVAAIDANLSTPYHETGRAGLEADQVLEIRAAWLARCAELEKKNGLAPGSLGSLGSAPPPTPDTGNGGDTPPPAGAKKRKQKVPDDQTDQ